MIPHRGCVARLQRAMNLIAAHLAMLARLYCWSSSMTRKCPQLFKLLQA